MPKPEEFPQNSNPVIQEVLGQCEYQAQQKSQHAVTQVENISS